MSRVPSKRRLRHTTLVVGAIVLGTLLISTGPASGATVAVSDTLLIYLADTGETNALAVSASSNRYRLADPGASIRAGSGCESVRDHEAICDISKVTSSVIVTSDGDDVVTMRLRKTDDSDSQDEQTRADEEAMVHVFGGAGNDVIQADDEPDFLDGGSGHDRITGGGGDDRLFGRRGEDQLLGEAGNDELSGGADADALQGGSGDDRARAYAGAADKVDCGSGLDAMDGDEHDSPHGNCDDVAIGIAPRAAVGAVASESAQTGCRVASNRTRRGKLWARVTRTRTRYPKVRWVVYRRPTKNGLRTVRAGRKETLSGIRRTQKSKVRAVRC